MIGRMDQRITLQRQVRTPDGVGGSTVGWENFAVNPCPWAQVQAKAGREGMVEGRMAATFTVLFIVYNRDDIDETSRIVWQGVNYNIRGIRRETGRALRLVIEAERGVAA